MALSGRGIVECSGTVWVGQLGVIPFVMTVCFRLTGSHEATYTTLELPNPFPFLESKLFGI